MQLKIEHKIELKINSGVLLINNILEGLYFELQIGLFIKPAQNRVHGTGGFWTREYGTGGFWDGRTGPGVYLGGCALDF